MRALTLEELKDISAPELIAGLENGEISLIKSFSSSPLQNMRGRFMDLFAWSLGLLAMKLLVGPACRFVLWCILQGGSGPQDEEYWRKKKEKAVRVGRLFFPDEMQGEVEDVANKALIVGFNHPTLHEVMGLIGWSLKNFPTRRNNFPTNLPWYESVCQMSPQLRNLGIYITPLITQNTFNKLEKIHSGNEEMLDTIKHVSKLLLNNYFDLAIDFERSGDNIFAAPSAARQRSIFPPNDARPLPVMSGLLYKIARANRDRKPDLIFLPITVIPLARLGALRGLRILRRYKFIIGRGFTLEQARKLGRSFDTAFLKRIAENAPKELWY